MNLLAIQQFKGLYFPWGVPFPFHGFYGFLLMQPQAFDFALSSWKKLPNVPARRYSSIEDSGAPNILPSREINHPMAHALKFLPHKSMARCKKTGYPQMNWCNMKITFTYIHQLLLSLFSQRVCFFCQQISSPTRRVRHWKYLLAPVGSWTFATNDAGLK